MQQIVFHTTGLNFHPFFLSASVFKYFNIYTQNHHISNELFYKIKNRYGVSQSQAKKVAKNITSNITSQQIKSTNSITCNTKSYPIASLAIPKVRQQHYLQYRELANSITCNTKSQPIALLAMPRVSQQHYLQYQELANSITCNTKSQPIELVVMLQADQ